MHCKYVDQRLSRMSIIHFNAQVWINKTGLLIVLSSIYKNMLKAVKLNLLSKADLLVHMTLDLFFKGGKDQTWSGWQKQAKEPSWKHLWGSGDIAIIETIDLCFPRYDQLQWNNDISVLFWPIHSEGNLFCVTGGLRGTTQPMCARDQREEEKQRKEAGKGHYFVLWPLLEWAPTDFIFPK